MDTSETFIKQCDCPEIQDGHHFRPYDGYGAKNKGFSIGEDCYYDLTWLPRQDQLQEMVLENQPFTYKMGYFNLFCCGLTPYDRYYIEDRKPTSLFGSMEQLWLAFVMKENHRKVWDGVKWINAEDA